MSAMRCSLAEKLKLVQRVLTYDVFASIIADGVESFDTLHSVCEAIHRMYVMGLAKLDPVPETLLVTMAVVEGLMHFVDPTEPCPNFESIERFYRGRSNNQTTAWAQVGHLLYSNEVYKERLIWYI